MIEVRRPFLRMVACLTEIEASSIRNQNILFKYKKGGVPLAKLSVTVVLESTQANTIRLTRLKLLFNDPIACP